MSSTPHRLRRPIAAAARVVALIAVALVAVAANLHPLAPPVAGALELPLIDPVPYAARSVSALTVSSLSTTPSASPTASPDATLVVIDPGHGGPFSNANANGLKEKNVNLALALALRDAFVSRGYRVLMTREDDRAVGLVDTFTWAYDSRRAWWTFARDGRANPRGSIPRDDLQARANVANLSGADLFISVHANGSKKRTVRGYETFASGRDVLGRSLARIVQRRVIARTGMLDRRAKTSDFYVLRWTNSPAVLLEAGFISNPSDAARLRNPEFLTIMAGAVADGVDEWMASDPYRVTGSRLGGGSASEHAAALSASQFPTGAPIAVLAKADDWAKVPGAAALAATLGGPLLWTDPDGALDATAAAELTRLAPERVVRLDPAASGGPGALSASIAAQIGVGPSGHVFVASAEDTRALQAAAPVAAYRRTPLLLAEGGALDPNAAAFLAANAARVRTLVLVGGESVLPTTVAQGLPYTRFTGSPFATLASALNSWTYTERRTNRMRPVVADPRFGPEYLSSAVRAARMGQPLLPVEGAVMPAKTREWITNRRNAIANFEVHDARGATPSLVDHQLRKADHP